HTTLLFSTDTPPTELYTLSLHDALPILVRLDAVLAGAVVFAFVRVAATLVYVARTFRFTLRFDRVLLTRQLSYAGPFGLAVLLYVVHTNLHQYIVSYRFDAATFAVYAVGC